jgi:hypothetical protein
MTHGRCRNTHVQPQGIGVEASTVARYPNLRAVYLAAQRLVIWAIRLLNPGAAGVVTARSLPVFTVS